MIDNNQRESEQLQKTTIPKVPSDLEREWYFWDLRDQIVGNRATEIVAKLRGKDRGDFLPNLDLGSYVVLTNAQHISFTGQKLDNEYYYNHSGHPGGMRERSLKIMLNNYPTELVRRIIKGMMPHTKLARRQLKRLFIYPVSTHPHQAQAKNFLPLNSKNT